MFFRKPRRITNLFRKPSIAFRKIDRASSAQYAFFLQKSLNGRYFEVIKTYNFILISTLNMRFFPAQPYSLFRYGYYCILAALFSCSTGKIKYDKGAVPPAAATTTFEVEPGFKIELIAAEPLVADPVDMEIDEWGRLYVVEMHGYPLDKSGSGKIKLLTDEDGDGVMDKSTVFADGLVLPNGVLRWKNGILVTDAPYVLFFEDTDNDGKADKRDTILTGFSLSNPHINVNNPIYGLDNWIHLSHRGSIPTKTYHDLFGDEGTEIYFNKQPDKNRLPKNANGHSIRFRPDTYEMEMTSGRGQFGHTFDVWGHHLFGDNQNHAFAAAIASPYVARNPALAVSQVTTGISDHGDAAEIFQITTHPERQLFSGAGTMTSASGIVAYAGGAFPPPFDKDITFICESVSNLVHADKLRDTGSTFIASRTGRPGKEFLASTDAWSRPVNLYVGPDGALYMLDYYRRIIEHPEWMSEEAVQAGGLYDGIDMGRIYRISAADAPPPTWTKGLALGGDSPEALVSKLGHPNKWWRTHAQRLLVDKADQSVAPMLEHLFDTCGLPEARVQALWTLQGLNSLSAATIQKALKDPVAGVRENAIRLAEPYLEKFPSLVQALLHLQNDPAPKVRFQLLCTLGYVNSREAGLARENILFRDMDDNWVQIAALSSAFSDPVSLLSVALKRYQPTSGSYASLTKRLAAMTGATAGVQMDSLIQTALSGSPRSWQAPLLAGLSDAFRNIKEPSALADPTQDLLIRICFTHQEDAVRKAAFQLLKSTGIPDNARRKKTIEQAAARANDKGVSDERRIDAINLLTLEPPVNYEPLLMELVVPQEHSSLQIAAIKALNLIPDTSVTGYLIKKWAALTQPVREEALPVFMVNDLRKKQLLKAVEDGLVPVSTITWSRRAQLMQDNEDDIRDKARALFINKDQEKIVRDFQQALNLTGNFDAGEKVFRQNCSLCHQIRGAIGNPFGPDLGTIQSWLAKDIMANVLDPGSSIAVGFDTRAVHLNNGETLQGIIINESSSAITLRTGPGVEKILNRNDIQSMTMVETSMMPSFSHISHQEMADLIAFLQQSRKQE